MRSDSSIPSMNLLALLFLCSNWKFLIGQWANFNGETKYQITIKHYGSVHIPDSVQKL